MFHRPRLLFAIHLGLFLGTAVACYLVYRVQSPKSDQRTPEPDHLLRSHLGLRSLRALYRFPEGKDYLVVMVLEVQDGGPPRPAGSRSRLSRDEVGGPDIQLEVLWGKVDGKMKLSENWSGYTLTRSDDFWENINGIYIFGRDTPKPAWQGFEVPAYAYSNSMIEPRTDGADESDEIAFAISRRRYVAILAVKPCATKAEADALVYGRHP